MKNIYLYLALLFLVACRNNSENQPQPQQFTPHTEAERQQTFHTDTAYQYESRTGESGDYQYNYDVSGSDDDGNDVSGNISIEGKYGTGTLINYNGDEVDVEVEWTGYGKLKATDDDGNEYELEVD